MTYRDYAPMEKQFPVFLRIVHKRENGRENKKRGGEKEENRGVHKRFVRMAQDEYLQFRLCHYGGLHATMLHTCRDKFFAIPAATRWLFCHVEISSRFVVNTAAFHLATFSSAGKLQKKIAKSCK